MKWLGWRRVTALYVFLFFVAAAVAPHHHINGLEDLLLDQPSDSGWVVENGEHARSDGTPAYDSFWLVDDDPCLACFSNDFVSAPAPVLTFAIRLERLAVSAPPPSKPAPDPISRDSSSRAPPSWLS